MSQLCQERGPLLEWFWQNRELSGRVCPVFLPQPASLPLCHLLAISHRINRVGRVLTFCQKEKSRKESSELRDDSLTTSTSDKIINDR